MVALSLYNAPMIYKTPTGEEVTPTHYESVRDTFLVDCQSIVTEHMKSFGWECILSIAKGRRYDKIVKADMHRPDNPSHSVYGFIDKTNGNILKAESWRKPAKNPRGNIYEDDRMLFMSAYGPAYMDSIKSYYGA